MSNELHVINYYVYAGLQSSGIPSDITQFTEAQQVVLHRAYVRGKELAAIMVVQPIKFDPLDKHKDHPVIKQLLMLFDSV